MNSLWDIINVPFGYVLRFCNKIVGNQYLFALLIFAIIIEVVLLPFGIKQQKNSIKQAKLRPKEMAIRKKYAGRDDQPTKQKMTQEIQELYQKEGYNPMGGCLPLLIQFPIIIALYNIVMSPLEYICGLSEETIGNIITVVKSFPQYAESAFTTTRNIDLMAAMKNIMSTDPAALSQFGITAQDLPNLSLFGGAIDLGAIPSIKAFNWLLLVPVLTFLAYFFSMRMTRKLTYQPTTANDPAMGCSNKMMDIVMPLFSVYITFVVPAAIGVYWIFKSLLGVLKQWILKKAMPLPVFTEEDYKAAEKEMNVRVDKAPKNKSGKIVRSLHHIDDEDFDDTREAAIKRREALEAQEAADTEAKKNAKGSSLLQEGSLKKDDKPESKEKKKDRSNMEAYRTNLKKRMDPESNKDDDKNNTDGEEK
ncbi:MAG: YidC/Oxa1 family membrane protein insertase [Clostridia bacterium]|nr:YidC/Oxa1 family membrane protein insertase [Clostridia bacterium]